MKQRSLIQSRQDLALIAHASGTSLENFPGILRQLGGFCSSDVCQAAAMADLPPKSMPADENNADCNKFRSKRSAAQRAADLLFIETHVLRGKTQAEIARSLSAQRPYQISRSQVAYDVQALNRLWLKASVDAVAVMKGKESRKLDLIESEAWDAWEQSKGDGAPGDVACMRLLLEIHDRRAKLLGLHAANRFELSGPEGTPIAVETRGNAPLDEETKKLIFQRYTEMIREERMHGGEPGKN